MIAVDVKEWCVQMDIFIPNHVPVSRRNSGRIVWDHVSLTIRSNCDIVE